MRRSTSSRAGCCDAWSTSTRCSHRPVSPRSGATTRSAACGAAITAVLTGATDSTRTESSVRSRRCAYSNRPDMHSALYQGWLSHRRHHPRTHAFRYRLFMVYLDLAELGETFRGRWLWSTSRRALARFDRRDHLGDPAVSLDESVRRLVAERAGK